MYLKYGMNFGVNTKMALTKMNIVEATGGNKVQRQNIWIDANTNSTRQLR